MSLQLLISALVDIKFENKMIKYIGGNKDTGLKLD